MENDSTGDAPLDGDTSKGFGNAKRIDPLPIFGKDAAMRIDKIKNAHGFNPDFDLLNRLRQIRYELREWFGYSAIATKQKRLFAQRISEHAEALLALFRSPHDDELAYLAGETTSRPCKKMTESSQGAGMDAISVRLVRLGPDLRWLADRATAANAQKIPRGRPEDGLMKNLIRAIRRVYVDAFGEKAARISRSNTFSGKFFDFVVAVIPLFGEEVPLNNTLGLLLTDACNQIDQEEEPKNNSDN